MRRQQRQLVTLRAQTNNRPDCDIGEIRFLPEFFPRMHIADVNFYERNIDSQNRITQ